MFRFVLFSMIALFISPVVWGNDVFQMVSKLPRPEVERTVVPPADEAFSDWKRVPYVETSPELLPTAEEQKIGMILFGRPLVDAIYPETRPHATERIQKIAGFGAWNQYETLNFALYPLIDLTGIRVVVGDLCCGDAVISAEQIEVRLVTYRDNTHPQYSSRGAWRRLPEYLQDVTTSDAPAFEPQRFCVTILAPNGIHGGHYRGNLLLSHDQFEQAIVLPIDYEVLPFTPKRDPNKHFSAYYYPPERHVLVTSKQRDAAWAVDVMRREFKTMAQYGFTRPPTLTLSYEEIEGQRKFSFKNDDVILPFIKENNMQEPLLMIGGGVTSIYTKMTGHAVGNHIILPELPPQEYYDEITRMAADFAKEAKEKNYPSMVFGPLDEIAGNDLSIEYGCGVYNAFKKGGLTTYTTMEPENVGFQRINPFIDIFGTQAYLPTYQEIVQGEKMAYWCYPNHNSYERKDPVIMNKGGRMTYGFGYWQSGFNMLAPWIWRNSNPNHFYDDKGSGGANILHPETGDVIMTIYWENFREGINDLNYVYTLQDAVIKRENSNDPLTQQAVASAKKLLQEIWDSINVQIKYLSENLWPSDQFDGYRLQLGRAIIALEQFPITSDKMAPSVIVEPRLIEFKADSPEGIYRRELARNNIEKLILANNEAENLGWIRAEEEASVELKENIPGAIYPKTVLLNFQIDTVKDGTGNPNGIYPAGWPAMNYYLKNNPILAEYDLFFARYLLKSNRPVDGTPKPADFYYSIRYQSDAPGSFTISPKLHLEEGKWTEQVYSLTDRFHDGIGPGNATLTTVRAGLAESNYRHGDELHFHFDELAFVRFKKPFLAQVEIPGVVPALYGRIRFKGEIMGPLAPQSTIRATFTLEGESSPLITTLFDLNDKKPTGQLNLNSIRAKASGTLKLELLDPNGQPVSEKSGTIRFD